MPSLTRSAARARYGAAALIAGLALCAGGYPTHAVFAHGIAGNRVFPVTLTIDDPAVADEASLPTFTYTPQGAVGGGPRSHLTTIGGELDKRITEHLGIAINETYSHLATDGQKNADGFGNLVTTLKYQFLQNGPHELLMSAGIIGEWGGTGSSQIGADRYGSITPTVYFGKGMGDLPDRLDWLKPFAITGTLGYQVSTVRDRSTTVIDPDTGAGSLSITHRPDLVVWGLSLQYSLPYLQSHVRDVGLPEAVGRLIPLVEASFTTPATNGFGQGTQGTISPGFIYLADTYQIGLEAVIPANRASGTNVGVLAQLHFFFDDIFPTTLGKPLFGD